MKSPINRFNPIIKPSFPSDRRGFNYGSDNLKPGYTFGSAPGTMDMRERPDGTYGPSISGYGYIQDASGNMVAKQGDANWNDFYNAVKPDVTNLPLPTAPQLGALVPESQAPIGRVIGGVTGGRIPAPRFGGIRKVLGRGR